MVVNQAKVQGRKKIGSFPIKVNGGNEKERKLRQDEQMRGLLKKVKGKALICVT